MPTDPRRQSKQLNLRPNAVQNTAIEFFLRLLNDVTGERLSKNVMMITAAEEYMQQLGAEHRAAAIQQARWFGHSLDPTVATALADYLTTDPPDGLGLSEIGTELRPTPDPAATAAADAATRPAR